MAMNIENDNRFSELSFFNFLASSVLHFYNAKLNPLILQQLKFTKEKLSPKAAISSGHSSFLIPQ